ncbi:MAG: hypothetical protein IJ661_12180 [Lachnospiraceae bacterium]|nr:hypothetical protein [Lachnospiraceae bacterium]
MAITCCCNKTEKKLPDRHSDFWKDNIINWNKLMEASGNSVYEEMTRRNEENCRRNRYSSRLKKRLKRLCMEDNPAYSKESVLAMLEKPENIVPYYKGKLLYIEKNNNYDRKVLGDPLVTFVITIATPIAMAIHLKGMEASSIIDKLVSAGYEYCPFERFKCYEISYPMGTEKEIQYLSKQQLYTIRMDHFVDISNIELATCFVDSPDHICDGMYDELLKVRGRNVVFADVCDNLSSYYYAGRGEVNNDNHRIYMNEFFRSIERLCDQLDKLLLYKDSRFVFDIVKMANVMNVTYKIGSKWFNDLCYMNKCSIYKGTKFYSERLIADELMERYYSLCIKLLCFQYEQNTGNAEDWNDNRDKLKDMLDYICINCAKQLGNAPFSFGFLGMAMKIYDKYDFKLDNITRAMYMQYIVNTHRSGKAALRYRRIIVDNLLKYGIADEDFYVETNIDKGITIRSLRASIDDIGEQVRLRGGKWPDKLVITGDKDKYYHEMLDEIVDGISITDNEYYKGYEEYVEECVRLAGCIDKVVGYSVLDSRYDSFIDILKQQRVDRFVLLLSKGFVARENIDVVIDTCIDKGYFCYIPYLLAYKER